MSDFLQPHGVQNARLPWPAPTSRACLLMSIESVMLSNHLILCGPLLLLPQSCLASESFPMSPFFTLGGQNIGASASVLPMNTQDWFPLGLTCLISLLSKGLLRDFSNTTVQKHQFFAFSFLYGPTLTFKPYMTTGKAIAFWFLYNYSFPIDSFIVIFLAFNYCFCFF